MDDGVLIFLVCLAIVVFSAASGAMCALMESRIRNSCEEILAKPRMKSYGTISKAPGTSYAV